MRGMKAVSSFSPVSFFVWCIICGVILVMVGLSLTVLPPTKNSEAATCTVLTRKLYRGLNDARTGGEVTKLQAFLASQGDTNQVTGYFGPTTELALKKFQRRYAIALYGTPDTTGYGAAGPITRAKIRAISCAAAPQPRPRDVPEPLAPPSQPSQTAPAVATGGLPPGVSVSCGPSPSTGRVGEIIRWTATISGGSAPASSYTYAWSGTDRLIGFTRVIDTTYPYNGVKTASVSVNGQVFQCAAVNIGGTAIPPEPSQPGQPSQPSQPTTDGPWPIAGLAPNPLFAYGRLEDLLGSSFSYLKPRHTPVVSSSGTQASVQFALQSMSSMAPGQRVFAIFAGYPTRILFEHPQDRCKTASGTFTNYPCPWRDNGATDAGAMMRDFAVAFRSAGGQMDHVAVDHEEEFSTWQMLGSDHADAIENDPRWPSLRDQLVSQYGFYFPAGSRLRDSVAGNWGPYATPQPQAADNYLKWNAAMKAMTASYSTQALYQPLRAQFPSVTMDEYGYTSWSQAFQVPDENGHRAHAYGAGGITGTHQGVIMNGAMNQITTSRPPIPGQPFPLNPFNTIKHSNNLLRAARLSSSAGLAPWFPALSLISNQLTQGDFYKENILQAAIMTKPGDLFILWNDTFGNTNDNQIMNAVLSEFNFVAGYANRQPIVNGLTPWEGSANAVYTGTQIGNYKIWRFTPEMSAGQSIGSFIQSSGTTDGSQSVIFTVGSRTYTFPNSYIFNPSNPVSRHGAWVVQRATASGPIIAEAGQGQGGTLLASVQGARQAAQAVPMIQIVGALLFGLWSLYSAELALSGLKKNEVRLRHFMSSPFRYIPGPTISRSSHPLGFWCMIGVYTALFLAGILGIILLWVM